MRTGRDIALTGVPRSGTTLCCRLLGDAVDTVALFEPMEVERLPAHDRAAVLDEIEGFFRESRRSLLQEGRAVSQQVGGRLPDNPFSSRIDADGRRRREAERGEIRVDKPLDPGFTLVVKHNASFTALLPELAQRFEVVAVVRNPLAVLASWYSVALPVSEGRVPAGERLAPELAQRLDAMPERLDRQLYLLDWLFQRYARHLPPARILRYEDVVTSGGAALARACGLDLPPGRLQERNASRLYDPVLCERLAARLLRDDGAWRRFYDEAAVTQLRDRLSAGAAPVPPRSDAPSVGPP